jgi:hypothetical protein
MERPSGALLGAGSGELGARRGCGAGLGALFPAALGGAMVHDERHRGAHWWSWQITKMLGVWPTLPRHPVRHARVVRVVCVPCPGTGRITLGEVS